MAETRNQRIFKFSSLILVIYLSHCSAADCKGCVQLDTFSFDKLISRFKAALVKFDVAYPYGVKQEEYGKVSEAAYNVNDLLIAEVGVKDFGDRDNSDLADRYNVKKDDFPVVKLFVNGQDSHIFTGKFKAENILNFIKSNSGVYIGMPGCIEEFDKLAQKFTKESNMDKKKSLLKETEDLWDKSVGNTKQKSAEIYVKTMRKILEKGDGFTEGELTRIDNILKGKLSKEKITEMQHRLNILQSFRVGNHDEL